MKKAEFILRVSDIARKYHAYAQDENSYAAKDFLGMSSLLEQVIINYEDQDFHAAARAFIEKTHKPEKRISYGTDDFLNDPDAKKQIRKTPDYLYDIFNGQITSNDVSKRTLYSLANISLHYIWDAAKVGPRGANQEIVLNQNDTDNIKFFCEVINFYKPEYAQVILAKASEILEPQLDNLELAFAIRIRNYFVDPKFLDAKVLYGPNNNIFADLWAPALEDWEADVKDLVAKIQDNMTAKQFESLLGNIKDGDRPASGVLGYIEANYMLLEHERETQGILHNYMDKLLLGN